MHHGRGGGGERPGCHGLWQPFGHIALGTVWPQAGATNRAPTSLGAGLRFHSCLPLVREAG